MKNILTLFTALCINLASGQEITTIYLIRHAEKADATADTHLSAAGKERAAKWAAYFNDKNITALYTTPYNRTRQTIQPLAEANNLTITEYNPGDFSLAALAKDHKGKSIVIAGHSNTIPTHINLLLGKKVYDDMPEDTFGNLYVITIKGNSITYELIKT